MIYFITLITAILNRFKGDDTVSKGWWFLIMIPMIIITSIDPIMLMAWALYLVCYAVPPTSSMLSCMMGRSQVRTDSKQWQWMYNYTVAVRLFFINKVFKNKNLSIVETWRVSAITYGFFRGLPAMIPVLFLYGYTGNATALFGAFLLLQGVPYYAFKKIMMPFPNHGDMPTIYSELTIGYFLGVYLLLL